MVMGLVAPRVVTGPAGFKELIGQFIGCPCGVVTGVDVVTKVVTNAAIDNDVGI